MTTVANVGELEAELLKTAIDRLIKMGLIEPENAREAVSLTIRIKGHSRHHDGFSRDIAPGDWARILKLPFYPSEMRMLEVLSKTGNAYLTGKQVKGYGLDLYESPAFTHMNSIFKQRQLPFLFAAKAKLRQVERLVSGKYCLYNKESK